MATKIYGIITGFYILSFIFECIDASYCYYYISDYYYYGSTYCRAGCCKYRDTYNPCCDFSFYTTHTTTYYYTYNYNYNYNYWEYNQKSLSVGTIAGIVIGCIVGLSVFISVVICIYNTNRRGNNYSAYGGQVITTGQPTVSYVTTSGAPYVQPNTQGGNVNLGFSAGPPVYNACNNSAPPPSYNAVLNNPAYHITSYPIQGDATPSNNIYANVPPHTDSNEHNNTTNETHTGSSAPSAPAFDSPTYM